MRELEAPTSDPLRSLYDDGSAEGDGTPKLLIGVLADVGPTTGSLRRRTRR
jgi:hypothetical protein